MTVRSINIRTYSSDTQLVEERRQQIAQAGFKIFSKYGYHKATMRQIVQASGLSTGSIYHYVGSKQDILSLAAEYAIKAGNQAIEHANYDISDPEKALRHVIEEIYRGMSQQQDMVLFSYQELKHLTPDRRLPILENDKRFAKVFERIIATGIEKGTFREDINPVVVSQDVVIMGHMWAFRRWSLSKDTDFENYLNSQIEFILNGCLKPKA